MKNVIKSHSHNYQTMFISVCTQEHCEYDLTWMAFVKVTGGQPFLHVSYLYCFLFFRSASRRASWRGKTEYFRWRAKMDSSSILHSIPFWHIHLMSATYLFLPEGAFSFHSHILTVPHHHEVLVPPLLLVAGASVWIQFGPLLNKLLPISPTCLSPQFQFS